jgi:aspartate kinase
MKVFKFGGASVKDAEAIRNVGRILTLHKNNKLIIVVSAIGKTTNLLERLIDAYWNENGVKSIFDEFKSFHKTIINDLKLTNSSTFHTHFTALEDKLNSNKSDDYNFEYDQLICFGELLSTAIISEYLIENSYKCAWVDARQVISTNNKWREAKVNWELTEQNYSAQVPALFESNDFIVTQGFIGGTTDNQFTTLGREGSDFTASIFAYISNSESVTIWKDVPGMLNADPRIFNGTVLLKQISFKEAIELAYYGASVIHPKTIQPLKNKEIPLFIKSFLKPLDDGTMIQSSMIYDSKVPSFIFKTNQLLLSLTPKDFSFVVEDNLKDIFSILADMNIRINLMQNSAVSFSFLIDDKYNLKKLLSLLDSEYLVKYNEGVELLTIRHYNSETVNRLAAGKTILLEQRSRQMTRLVLKPEEKK